MRKWCKPFLISPISFLSSFCILPLDFCIFLNRCPSRIGARDAPGNVFSSNNHKESIDSCVQTDMISLSQFFDVLRPVLNSYCPSLSLILKDELPRNWIFGSGVFVRNNETLYIATVAHFAKDYEEQLTNKQLLCLKILYRTKDGFLESIRFEKNDLTINKFKKSELADCAIIRLSKKLQKRLVSKGCRFLSPSNFMVGSSRRPYFAILGCNAK